MPICGIYSIIYIKYTYINIRTYAKALEKMLKNLNAAACLSSSMTGNDTWQNPRSGLYNRAKKQKKNFVGPTSNKNDKLSRMI